MRFAMISLFIHSFFSISPSPLCLAVVCSLRSIMLFPVSCGQQTRESRKKEKEEKYWSVMVKWLDPWRSGPQGKGHTSSLPYHVISLICLQWENGNWITWPAPMPRSGLYSKVCQHKLKKNLLYLTGFACLKLTVSPGHSLQGFRFLCGMCLGVQRGGK